jgi:osmotically-inducible protein OsmY
MPRSKRRHETSSERQGRQSEFNRNRGGGFEETGTGYRHDDQQRQFGNPQYQNRFGRSPQEPWRDNTERSQYSEGRDYGSGYDYESRFGRGRNFEGTMGMGGRQGRSQGYPESYRDAERGYWGDRQQNYWDQDEESGYGRARESAGYGSEEYRDLEGGLGYEPGDWSNRGFQQSGSQTSWGQGGYRGSAESQRDRFRQGYQGRGSQQQYRSGTGQGAFAGRGPQGYKRSDDRITEDVNEMLTQDPEIDASNITVEVHNGELTLKGFVTDREAKRRAEDIAESTSGVKDVQNQLRIKREDESESDSRRDKTDDKQKPHRQQIAS